MPERDPLISVIVIFRNERAFIEEAVRSVLAQPHRPLELILVDDGSSDGSADAALALEFGDVDPILVTRTTDHSAPAARNAGIARASGYYVMFLDGDDELVPDAIGPLLAHLRDNPDCDVVIGHRELVVEPGVTVPRFLRHEGPGARRPHFMTMLVPASTLEITGGFDVRFAGNEDTEWVLRARLLELRLDVIEATVLRYRMHGDNTVYDLDALQRRQVRLLRHLITRRHEPLKVDLTSGVTVGEHRPAE